MASGLGRAVVALIHIVALSFVASLAVICLRALIDRIWSGTLLVMYNLISFVAVAANMLVMHLEVHKGGGHWSWANYGFWWLLLAGETFIGWFHLEGIPTEGKSINASRTCSGYIPFKRFAVYSLTIWLDNYRILSGF